MDTHEKSRRRGQRFVTTEVNSRPPLLSTSECNSQESGGSSLKTDWLTTVEAAAYLKISVGSLRNMVCNGTVPVHRMGRRLRFLVIELNSLLVASTKGVSHGN